MTTWYKLQPAGSDISDSLFLLSRKKMRICLPTQNLLGFHSVVEGGSEREEFLNIVRSHGADPFCPKIVRYLQLVI
jgi:hypothetical protein